MQQFFLQVLCVTGIKIHSTSHFLFVMAIITGFDLSDSKKDKVVISLSYQITCDHSRRSTNRWLIFLPASRKLIITKENNIKRGLLYEIHSSSCRDYRSRRGIGKGCALELARGGFNLLITIVPMPTA